MVKMTLFLQSSKCILNNLEKFIFLVVSYDSKNHFLKMSIFERFFRMSFPKFLKIIFMLCIKYAFFEIFTILKSNDFPKNYGKINSDNCRSNFSIIQRTMSRFEVKLLFDLKLASYIQSYG